MWVELVSHFNSSLAEYQNQNQILHEENEKYEMYTAELNQTVISLVSNLTEVTESETNLAKTVEEKVNQDLTKIPYDLMIEATKELEEFTQISSDL